MEGTDKKKGSSFWGTFPGIITAVAGLLTALGSCIAVILALPRPNIIFPATPTPIVITAQTTDLEDNSTAPQAPTTVPQAVSQPTAIPPTTIPTTANQPTPVPPTAIPPTPIPPKPKSQLTVTDSRLYVGENLQSGNGRFTLQLQTNGNLVLYDQNSSPIWSTNTSGQKAEFLAMQEDGNLVLYGENGTVLWASESASSQFDNGYVFQVNDDGNLVIYLYGAPKWNSGTSQ